MSREKHKQKPCEADSIDALHRDGQARSSDEAAVMAVERRVFDEDSYGYRPGKSAHDAIAVTRKRCWRYDWVVEFDIRGLFDNIRHDMLMKAIRHHCDCPWVLLYIERWLTAPLKQQDGSLTAHDQGTPQGGVVSPILANLFLHYAFDAWVRREMPRVPFCRYADDGLLHCKSRRQAEYVMRAISERFQQCGLEIHPDKSCIVYCKDANRQEDYSRISFTLAAQLSGIRRRALFRRPSRAPMGANHRQSPARRGFYGSAFAKPRGSKALGSGSRQGFRRSRRSSFTPSQIAQSTTDSSGQPPGGYTCAYGGIR